MPKAPPPIPESSPRVEARVESRTFHERNADARGVRVRPFRFDDLARYPRDIVDVHRALIRILPEAVFEAGFMNSIRRVVQHHAGVEVDLWLHAIRVLRRSQLQALIPGTSFIAIIGLAPLSEKLLVEVDLRFVYRVVDQLLGGRGAAVDVRRPLTEIEHGVFSFVALKVLQLFQGQFTHPEQVALRLEDARNDLRSCADIVRDQDLWVSVAWKMNFDLDVGYVRILVPSSLARQVTVEAAPAGSPLAARLETRTRARIGRLAGVTAEATVEIGRIELSLPDLDALDPGDIILIEQTQVGLTEHGLSGPAKLKIGRGRRAIVHGEIGVQDVAGALEMVFQVGRIEAMPTPTPEEPIGASAPEADLAHALSPERAYEESSGEGSAPNQGGPDDSSEGYDGFEDGYDEDEADDGRATDDDLYDEDYGLDDEDAGPKDEYDDYEEGYDEAYEEGYGSADEVEEGQADDEGGDSIAEGHADGFAAGGDDNLAEAHPLLGDIPVSIAVELGRVALTADEVIRLRAGIIVELGRTPNAPVDLVISGRTVAKGELVEIEGQLGVKILNLTKGGE